MSIDRKQLLARKKLELDKLLEEYLEKSQKILDDLNPTERAELGNPIKGISQLDRFKANGHNYVVRSRLGLARFEVFDESHPEITFGLGFEQLYNNLNACFDLLNKAKPADAAVRIHNMMNGIATNLEKRENPVLKICTLFICREDEDLTTYDEALAKQKIEDWRIEGIDSEHFFSLAFNSVRNFMPIYRQVSQNISEGVKQVRNDGAGRN